MKGLLAGLSAAELEPKLILGDGGGWEEEAPKEKGLVGWFCVGGVVPKLGAGDGCAPPKNRLFPPWEGLEEPNRLVDVDGFCPKVVDIWNGMLFCWAVEVAEVPNCFLGGRSSTGRSESRSEALDGGPLFIPPNPPLLLPPNPLPPFPKEGGKEGADDGPEKLNDPGACTLPPKSPSPGCGLWDAH